MAGNRWKIHDVSTGFEISWTLDEMICYFVHIINNFIYFSAIGTSEKRQPTIERREWRFDQGYFKIVQVIDNIYCF